MNMKQLGISGRGVRRAGTIAVAAACLTTAFTAPAFAAPTAKAMVNTQRMSQPTYNSTQTGWYAKGSTLQLVCYSRGQSARGYYSPWIKGGYNNLWYRVSDGGWVADVDISTGSNNPVTPDCASVDRPAPAPSASYQTYRGQVAAGVWLNGNDRIMSNNGRAMFVQQADGNLVLYLDGAARWATYKMGAGNRTILQGDGNLVSYAPGRAVWASNTVGSGAQTLAVQDDGNVVLYAPGGRAVWSTQTSFGGNTASGVNMDAFVQRTRGRAWPALNGDYMGECVSLVSQYLSQVYGIRSGAWGDAIAYRAGDTGGREISAHGFRWGTDRNFRNGDILVWGAGIGERRGHIGIWYNGQVYHQNWAGRRTADLNNFPAAGFLGYWRK